MTHQRQRQRQRQRQILETEARAREGLNGSAPAGLLGTVYRAFAGIGANPLTLSSVMTEHCQALASRASQESAPAEWIDSYLAQAKKLRDQGDGVWNDQPWSPHFICSEKMMVRIIESMTAKQRERSRHKAPPKREELSPEERAEAAAAATALKETIHNRRRT